MEVGVQKAWNLCEKYKLPRFFFVSNMDFEHASYTGILDALTELYGKKVAPLFLPMKENDKFTGYVDVVRQKAFRYQDKQKKAECPVPGDLQDEMENYRASMIETVAETSEEMMERYFEGEEFSDDEIISALKENVSACDMVPVTMGSSINLQGVLILLDDIVSYFPSPADRKIAGVNLKNDEPFNADYDASKPKSAFIWKTIVDPFIGKYSMIKVCSGSLKGDDMLYYGNVSDDLTQIVVPWGQESEYLYKGTTPISIYGFDSEGYYYTSGSSTAKITFGETTKISFGTEYGFYFKVGDYGGLTGLFPEITGVKN